MIHFIANTPCACRALMVKAIEVTQVRYNRKNWFFKYPSFWQFGINYLMWTSILRTKTMLNVSFKFEYLLMRLVILLPAQHLLSYIDPWREQTEYLNAYQTLCKYCQSNINSRSTKIAFLCSCIWCLKLCMCMWCMASLVDIFEKVWFQNLWNNSPRLKQLTKQRFINKQTTEKEFFIQIIEICCNSGMLIKSYRP